MLRCLAWKLVPQRTVLCVTRPDRYDNAVISIRDYFTDDYMIVSKHSSRSLSGGLNNRGGNGSTGISSDPTIESSTRAIISAEKYYHDEDSPATLFTLDLDDTSVNDYDYTIFTDQLDSQGYNNNSGNGSGKYGLAPVSLTNPTIQVVDMECDAAKADPSMFQWQVYIYIYQYTYNTLRKHLVKPL